MAVSRGGTERGQGWPTGPRANVGLSLVAAGIRMNKGKVKAARAVTVHMVFAKSIRGMHPWHFMEKAFKAPETQAYFQQRLQQMWAKINAALG